MKAVKSHRVLQLTSDLWYLSGGGLYKTNARRYLKINSIKINRYFV